MVVGWRTVGPTQRGLKRAGARRPDLRTWEQLRSLSASSSLVTGGRSPSLVRRTSFRPCVPLPQRFIRLLRRLPT